MTYGVDEPDEAPEQHGYRRSKLRRILQELHEQYNCIRYRWEWHVYLGRQQDRSSST